MKEGWDGGIQEEPARPVMNVFPESSAVGRSSTGLLMKSPSHKSQRKKSVRFNNAVTVKVVPRVSQVVPPKTSFITGTLLDPTTRTFRYLLLFLLSVQTFGPNFTRFSPNILEDQLISTFQISSNNFFLMLFAVADIPALILVLVGGYLIDKYFTVGKWAIGFAVGVVVGQLIFALGAFIKSLAVLMAGRVLFSAAAGSLYVTQAASMARWLVGLEMGLAVGVAVCISELTYIFAVWMLPIAANDYGVGQSLVLGALMSVASLSATVLASALDAWGNDQLPKAPKESMYRPQTVVTTKTMTATMTTPKLPVFSPSAHPPLSTLPTHIDLLPPLSPPLHTPPPASPQISASSPSISHQGSPSNPQILPQSPTLTPTLTHANIEDVQNNNEGGAAILSDDASDSSGSSESLDLPSPQVPPNIESIQESIKESLQESTQESIQESYTEHPNIETDPPRDSRNVLTASMQISKRSSVTDAASSDSPRSVSAAYGTNTFGAEFEAPASAAPRFANEERRHYVLLLMLVGSAILILPSGVISHSLGDFENILYYAAAAAPAVGWVLDRLGRPCMFLGVGAIAQLAVLLTSLFARALHGYTRAVDEAVEIIMGITWSVTMCSAYTGLALLVRNGRSGTAFAALTVVNAAAMALAPLFYAYTHSDIGLLIAAAASTGVGLVILCFVYNKRSVLNLNAHDIRRVIGYAIDTEERAPLLANTL